MKATPKLCLSCYYARDRKDVAGVYCTGKWLCKKDRNCPHYRNWHRRKPAIEELVSICGGRENVRKGLREGVPFAAFLAGIYFFACAVVPL